MASDTTSDMPARQGGLTRLARACARHPWRAIGAWIAIAILIIAGAGGTLVDEFTIPDSDTQRAVDLLEERFPARAGEAAQIVFVTEVGRLGEGANREAVEAALAAAGEHENVVEVGDPLEGFDGAISEDETIAFADAQFNERPFEVELSSVEEMQEAVDEELEDSDVRAEYTGPVILNSETPETGTSELLGILAAAIHPDLRLRLDRGEVPSDRDGDRRRRARPGAPDDRRRHLDVQHLHAGARDNDRVSRRNRLLALHRHALQTGASRRPLRA
jgi:hypothetical protein